MSLRPPAQAREKSGDAGQNIVRTDSGDQFPVISVLALGEGAKPGLIVVRRPFPQHDAERGHPRHAFDGVHFFSSKLRPSSPARRSQAWA